ncbi:hypothetical protein [Streptomyces virginiae]|uniref:hypothetical protein n=1 Tax=Streptomyces virginiae TaxID=1961 RepID=UPI00364E4B8E
MTDPPTIDDIRNVVACLDLLHADAVIEDALNPKPLLDPETLDLIHMGLDSGDPVKVAATEILVDLYRIGAFGRGGER